MGLQTFSGKGPHRLLWAGLRGISPPPPPIVEHLCLQTATMRHQRGPEADVSQ
jgi:hypothetical protein